MRPFLLIACAATALLAPAPGQAAKPSWAKAEIRTVVARGLMGPSVRAFRPNDVLTRGELEDAVAALRGEPGAAPREPATPVTVAFLDARLVRALDLADEAWAFAAEARAEGLDPPERFGTEVVARMLGLRINHDYPNDERELLPSDPATRAEAAYSLAQALRLDAATIERVRGRAGNFTLPELTGWQRRVLRTAVDLVGYPYVWGGFSEHPQPLWGVTAPGGFDCSGFVWRVFKGQAHSGAARLGDTLRGRTTYVMSAEMRRATRVPFARLAPADIVFFGAAGPRSRPAQIEHMGLALGNGWIVHASRYGVAVTPLEDWYRERFAWARRPLAEAGLSPVPLPDVRAKLLAP